MSATGVTPPPPGSRSPVPCPAADSKTSATRPQAERPTRRRSTRVASAGRRASGGHTGNTTVFGCIREIQPRYVVSWIAQVSYIGKPPVFGNRRDGLYFRRDRCHNLCMVNTRSMEDDMAQRDTRKIATFHAVARRNGRASILRVRRLLPCAEYPGGKGLGQSWVAGAPNWPDTAKGTSQAAEFARGMDQ